MMNAQTGNAPQTQGDRYSPAAPRSLSSSVREILLRVPRLFIATSSLIAMMGVAQWAALGLTRPDGTPAVPVRHGVIVQSGWDATGQRGFTRLMDEVSGGVGDGLVSVLHWHELSDPNHSRKIDTAGQAIHQAAVSPTGEWLAIGARDGGVGLIDLRSPSRSIGWLNPPDQAWVTRIRWSPDGKTLLATTGEAIYGWSLPQRALRFRRPFPTDFMPCLIVAEDSQTFGLTQQQDLHVFDIDSGVPLRHYPLPIAAQGLAYSVNSGIAVAAGNGAVAAIRLTDGLPVWRLPSDTTRQISITSDPGGRWLASIRRDYDRQGSRRNLIEIHELASGNQVATLVPRIGEIIGIEFIANDRLSFWSDSGQIAIWQLETASENALVTLDSTTTPHQAVSGFELWRHRFGGPDADAPDT